MKRSRFTEQQVFAILKEWRPERPSRRSAGGTGERDEGVIDALKRS